VWDAALQELYDDFNLEFFRGRLPTVLVGYSKHCKQKGAFGLTLFRDGMKHASHIVINPDLEDWGQVAQQTVLHEMCHVRLTRSHNHGPRFQKELKRLIKAGAFDSLL
jgi:predicted SprT family Zn-dependent metalloprotease